MNVFGSFTTDMLAGVTWSPGDFGQSYMDLDNGLVEKTKVSKQKGVITPLWSVMASKLGIEGSQPCPPIRV